MTTIVDPSIIYNRDGATIAGVEAQNTATPIVTVSSPNIAVRLPDDAEVYSSGAGSPVVFPACD